MQKQTIGEALIDSLDLSGKTVLDIGCGDGSLVRLIAEQGAAVMGIDPNAGQIAAARAKAKIGTETFQEGVAENLPAKDGSVDVVVFSNSLHHVPVVHMESAVAEAARVLKPDGILYVAEPLAEGPRFELSRQLEDETAVRKRVVEILNTAQRWGLEEERRFYHATEFNYGAFEDFTTHAIKVAPERAGRIAAKEVELRDAFLRIGKKASDGNGWVFEQPHRVNILRKRKPA